MIHVLAAIEVHPGRRADFLAEFHRLVPLVHAEHGCIEYGPAIDVKTSISGQVAVGENTVMVIEKWSDVPALEAHLAAPHMNDYRKKVGDMVKNVAIQILEPA